jgi:hypothetical protein
VPQRGATTSTRELEAINAVRRDIIGSASRAQVAALGQAFKDAVGRLG